MKNLLLPIMLIFAVFSAMGQLIPDNVNSPDCDAKYVATPDPQNPMTLRFEDQSTGQISLWQWSFGDGATSTQQNPVHTYSEGGTYFVCLTISNSDSGMICHDVLCLAITVHEPGMCIADYTYLPDVQNTLLFAFTDKSSGSINRWHWSFGDGTSSDERNPDHVFPAFGKYPVCLTAYNADSISVCHDVKCDTIEINPPVVCHASFSYILDTLNPLPLTYRFTSSSTGDPTHYQWHFGDGASSASAMAMHRFPAEGSYKVCLTILRKAGDFVVCSDSVCQTITTAKYFNLGGHLFIGDHPINNPAATGDTGVAYLFRNVGTSLIPVDTNVFTNLGYYAFPRILNGSYVIKAALTPGSTHYGQYIPAYFPNTPKWMEAISLNLFDSNDYNSHILLVPVDTNLNGPGKITGTVILGDPEVVNTLIPFAEIILYDSQLKPLHYQVSDQHGEFIFGNLPYGSYYLYVEYPGKYSRLTPVWLDNTVPVSDSVLLGVFGHNVTGIAPLRFPECSAGTLFPNPTDGLANIYIKASRKMEIGFEIVDFHGRTMYKMQQFFEEGPALATIPVGSLQPGVYLLRIIFEGDAGIFVRKIIKL